jgi:hypothetical protein
MTQIVESLCSKSIYDEDIKTSFETPAIPLLLWA